MPTRETRDGGAGRKQRRSLWRRRRTDEDFADEIRAHLDLEARRLVDDEGMSPEDARARAHRTFGNVTRSREQFHLARRIVWLEQVAQDLRYAWRGLLRSRSFLTTMVLTLAVGMGFVTVVFAILNAYVLRPFAVHDPYSLHSVGWRSQEAGGSTFRWSDYEEFRARDDLFEAVVAEATGAASWAGRQLAVGFVSGNYFVALGPRLLLGRALLESDARSPGGEPVAVLTHQAWTRLFDRDPTVLGREIDVNGRTLVIVGVMSAEFVGLDDAARDIWVPLTMYGDLQDEDLFGANQPRALRVTTRLRRDIAPGQAQASLTISPFETRVPGRVDAVRATLRMQATPVRMTLAGFAFLSPVFAAFGLVLVAACANASNVMLARANARHREIGIRLSIGASRGRIVRQLLTEGLLIALMAGLAGLALAGALLRAGLFLFLAMLPAAVAGRVRFVPLDFDVRVFLFAFLVAGVATLLFALLPALQATRVTLTDVLRGQASSGVRASTLRGLLVTSQVAVSLLLLVVAATLVRNGTAIRATDLGLETDGIVSVRPRRSDNGLLQRAFDALTTDPRVAQVVVTSRNPLFGETPRVPLRQPSGMVLSSYTFVSPEYFAMLRISILHGRGFTTDEAAQQAPVAIVSAAAATALWPGADPIGKTLRINIEPPGQRMIADTIRVLRATGEDTADTVVVTIVGVATDVVSGFVYQGTDSAHIYMPTSANRSRAAALMVSGPPPGIRIDALKSVLQQAHSDPLAFDVLLMDDMVALQMFPLRAASWIGSLLSAVALSLSVAGLYGVLMYLFGQRTHEIGIRMALGASSASVVRLVVLQSARLAAFGTVIGLTLTFSVMMFLSTVIRLDNVSVIDPVAFAVSAALIAVAVGLASYGPARRATRIDPSSMLRADA